MDLADKDTYTANPFTAIDPLELQFGLHKLMSAYQTSRSALRAWLVVHYAEAICQHPDFEGTDEQRCAYRRLASQWRWLASRGGRHEDPGLTWGTLS